MEIKRLMTPTMVMQADGIRATEFYRRCAAGEYECVKDGTKTKVTEESVIARRARLPKARYNIRRGVRGIPPKQQVTAR
jgi:hypothetical protein